MASDAVLRVSLLVEQVDEAPVRQVADGELGHAAERVALVVARSQGLAGAGEDVELALAVGGLGGGRALRGEQALALLAGVFRWLTLSRKPWTFAP